MARSALLVCLSWEEIDSAQYQTYHSSPTCLLVWYKEENYFYSPTRSALLVCLSDGKYIKLITQALLHSTHVHSSDPGKKDIPQT